MLLTVTETGQHIVLPCFFMADPQIKIPLCGADFSRDNTVKTNTVIARSYDEAPSATCNYFYQLLNLPPNLSTLHANAGMPSCRQKTVNLIALPATHSML